MELGVKRIDYTIALIPGTSRKYSILVCEKQHCINQSINYGIGTSTETIYDAMFLI